MKMLSADIAAIPHAEARGFNAAEGFSVSGISTDSRTVQRGELFVAVRGERFDGHNFISLAVRNGAAAIVIEKRWADVNGPMLISMPLPKLIVEDTTIAFGQLANVYRSQFKIPVVAVGGSNGKTTTKEMVRAVLARKFNVLATEGNLNNHIGVPQTLFRLEPSHEAAIIEVGTNHPGEIAYLCGILRPTHGLITNIGREHLEFFGTVDGVADAEAELFAYLRGSKGTAFVNADDALIAKRSKPLTKKKTFGMTARSVFMKGRVVSMNDRARSRFAAHCVFPVCITR
jgi:UDP-N-acetylmuramoyl-tripeptide--D-alanyl-D-alanine ligase